MTDSKESVSGTRGRKVIARIRGLGKTTREVFKEHLVAAVLGPLLVAVVTAWLLPNGGGGGASSQPSTPVATASTRVVPSQDTKPQLKVVQAVSDPADLRVDFTYAFPGSLILSSTELAQLNALTAGGDPTDPAVISWFHQRNGVPLNHLRIRVTLQNTSEATVLIQSMQIRSQCRAPLTGTLFEAPAGAEGDVSAIGFDLDSSNRTARVFGSNGLTDKPYFANKDLSLAPGELQTIMLHVLASTKACKFTFDLGLTGGAGPSDQILDNQGKPFEVTGEPKDVEGSYRVLYMSGFTLGKSDGDAFKFFRQDPKNYR